MFAVEKLGSYITRGVYTVSGPFHPFGGAVDIIVVEQQDGSFKTSPWYVRFGKFQGVLKTKEKVVNICVNGVDADFHMYLDHKGEAYFLKEVDIEEGETGLYQSSSGEETDGQSDNRDSIKSKSCNYDDQIEVKDGEVMVRSSSRRGRILGLVFGRKSIKEISKEKSDTGIIRADSLERAEIAANLLEVKWSTDLATKRSGKDKESRFSGTDFVDKKVAEALRVNGDQSPVSPIVEDTLETSTSTKVSLVPNEDSDTSVLEDKNLEEQGEVVTILSIDKFANLSVIEKDLDEKNLDEKNLEEKNLDEKNLDENDLDEKDLSSHGLADETQKDKVHSSAYCETSDSSRLDLNGECNPVVASAEIATEKSENLSEVNNLDNPIVVINESESLSSVDRHLATSDSVENEASVSGFSNSVNQVKVEKHVTYDNHVDEIQPQQRSNISPSRSEELQFPFGDLDDLKVGEVKFTGSISPDHSEETDLPALTLISNEAVNDLSSKNYELHSFLDECVQRNVPRQTSSPINILQFHEFDGAKVDRVAVSLPNLLSNVDTLGSHNLHHPCRSLDLDRKPSKWALLRENASTCIKVNVDEQRLVEGQLTIGDNPIPDKLINAPFRPADGDLSKANVAPSGNWGMWPFSFKRSRTLNAVEPGLNRIMSSSDVENATEGSKDISGDKTEPKSKENKKKVRLLTPTSEQLACLKLKDGMNIVTFAFSTAMLGKQQVDARIYLWKWNTRVVISDVDGTITKSDVLGQFMPWVGVDWSQTGVAHLFSAIKENGYQLLFLSARAISQAYLTRQFLCNLKQDGKALPDGPVVISPDGLFPSLFREVIRRAPHEFKIACLEDIKALFPSDISPFYAGFGNRDTDEISYLKVGIPKGKIFIINPKGEIVVNGRIDTKSYPSLHALVHNMFPPMSSTEQEDYNAWNYWKLPPPTVHG